jgi:hypothetical protein
LNSRNTVPFWWHTFGFWLVLAIFNVPQFRSQMWPLCHQFSLFFCGFCSVSYIRFVLLNQLQSSDWWIAPCSFGLFLCVLIYLFFIFHSKGALDRKKH